MSPTPARTSTGAIVEAARVLLEEDGLEAMTMATVATRVGVRPPSLYKHVRDRAALVAAVTTDAAEELARLLAGADPGPSEPAAARIAALGVAYRAYARRCPRAATLLFSDLGAGSSTPVEVAARAAAPIVEAAAALVGPAAALAAARVLTAFVHGFTSMEAAGAFHLGGDVDAAFALGIAALPLGLRAAAVRGEPI